MTARLQESINKDKTTETEKILKIMELIENENKYITIRQITKWCCENGCYDTLRRGQMLILKIIEENNKRFNN